MHLDLNYLDWHVLRKKKKVIIKNVIVYNFRGNTNIWDHRTFMCVYKSITERELHIPLEQRWRNNQQILQHTVTHNIKGALTSLHLLVCLKCLEHVSYHLKMFIVHCCSLYTFKHQRSHCPQLARIVVLCASHMFPGT